MPRADIFPEIKTALSEVPSPTNPLGVRSGGEGGTTPELGAVVNATVDASPLCVRHIEMPATPGRVWRAIRTARAGAVAVAVSDGESGPTERVIENLKGYR